MKMTGPGSVLPGIPALLGAMMMAGCASLPKANLRVDDSRQRAHIQHRLDEIFDAAEKKDMARLDSYHFYGPTFTKFAAGQLGRQDATAARQGEHAGLGLISGLSMRADDLKIDVFGDVGIATFILNYNFKGEAGTIWKKERATLVFVEDQGTWKITHEHFSAFKDQR